MTSKFNFQLSKKDLEEFAQYYNDLIDTPDINFYGNRWNSNSLPENLEGNQVLEILNIFDTMYYPPVFVDENSLTVQITMVDEIFNFLPNHIYGNEKIENIKLFYKLLYISWYFKYPTIFRTQSENSNIRIPTTKIFLTHGSENFTYIHTPYSKDEVIGWCENFSINRDCIENNMFIITRNEESFDNERALNSFVRDKLALLANIVNFKIKEEPETSLESCKIKPDIHIVGDYHCSIQLKRKLISYAMEEEGLKNAEQKHRLTFQCWSEALAIGLTKSIVVDFEKICLFRFSYSEEGSVQADYQIFDYTKDFNLFSLLALLLKEHFTTDSCNVSKEEKEKMVSVMKVKYTGKLRPRNPPKYYGNQRKKQTKRK
ncbi:uncharacterized protein KGF55_002601 [Candida pseudojiufengensis]|uniref:uncharacterized protein n=1 Tax=Candida pseudojiufengensis TaxID=497109 RepID=UPI002225288C|nr:uncharacterized protein KGF55_002601 [Candida pseudojiufengensis]KAI5963721.1 hypothetical protein KGF55_002601 [Candida pseudojiufengensis]